MKNKKKYLLRQLSDSEYFLRPEIMSLLTALLRNLTKKKLSVTLVCEDSKVAYTTGVKTVVNVLNKLTQGFALRSDKLLTLMGLVGHEAGHVLYSDFEMLNQYVDGLESGEYVKEFTDFDPKYETILEDVRKYYDENPKATGKVLATYGKEAFNILEDGFINPLIMMRFPGNVAKGLRMVIGKTLEEYPTAEVLLEEPLCGRLGIVHQYVLGGSYLGNAGTYHRELEEMNEIAQQAIEEMDAGKRIDASFLILLYLWEDLKTLIDETVFPDELSDSQIVEHLQKHFGECSPSAPISITASIDDASDEESSGHLDGVFEGDPSKDVDETIISNMAKEARIRMIEDEHDAMELLPDGNTVIDMDTLPSVPDDADEKVQMLRDSLNRHTRRMVSQTRNLLEEKEGGILNGQICGGRIGNNLYRKDQKIFVKKVLPGPDISMAVGILVDKSASMAGYGEKNLKAARMMAFMAYHFCRQLDIPVSVIGHGTEGNVMHIDVVTDFEASLDDERRIATMGSYTSNYDAYAIEYMGKRLLNRSEDLKILFVISDGEPTYPYCKEEEDLIKEIRAVVSKLRKRGIIVIATAMDMELGAVQAIYEKDCMNISDLSLVPTLFPRLITKYL